MAGQGNGYDDALAHAAGELRRVRLAGIGKTDEPQQLGHLRAALLLAHTHQLQWVADVVRDGARVEQVCLLEDQADAAPRGAQLVRAGAGELHPVDLDGARGGAIEHREATHQGGFTGPGMPDDAVDGARRHGERDAVQGVHLPFALPVDLVQVRHGDHRRPPHARESWQHSTSRARGRRIRRLPVLAGLKSRVVPVALLMTESEELQLTQYHPVLGCEANSSGLDGSG